MNDGLKKFLLDFYNWVTGNGARTENEDAMTELPPVLPFTMEPDKIQSRFHEKTLQERRKDWINLHGLSVFSILYRSFSIITCVVIVGLLLITVSELPPFGDENNPANNEVIDRYIKLGGNETGAQNIVAGMILDYRAFDTFGESAVLFTGAVSVLMILSAARRKNDEPKNKLHSGFNDRNFLKRAPPIHELKDDDAILRGVASLSIPAIILMGCVVIINGHLTPGGGFSGGAVLSTALILCANAYGFKKVHEFFNERTYIFSSSSALLIYALSKGYSFFTGANHIESGIPIGTIGNIFSAGLILPLNICVGIIVAGTLYGVYALFSEGEI